MFTDLKQELQKVQSFYAEQYDRLRRKYVGIASTYEKDGVIIAEELNLPDLIHVLGFCLEYSQGLKRLRWYGKVNSDALEAMFRKVDAVASSTVYERLDIAAYEFFTQTKSLHEVEKIDVLIENLETASHGAHDLSFLVRQMSARSLSYLDGPLVETFKTDNADSITKFPYTPEFSKAFKQALLHQATMQQSKECTLQLLQELRLDLQDVPTGTKRNCIHTLVIMAGLLHSLPSHDGSSGRYKALVDKYADKYGDISSILSIILESLDDMQSLALMQRDYRGRTPLHYAAEAGVGKITRDLLFHMGTWGFIWADWLPCGLLGPSFWMRTKIHPFI